MLVLCLVTGLPTEEILNMRWSSILTLGSENDAVVKKKIEIRKYTTPIHPQVANLIGSIYVNLGYPDLNSRIKDGERLGSHIPRALSSVLNRYSSNWDDKGEKTIDPKFTQIMFGRRVFEVNGYTSTIAKKLKILFGFKSNEELFQLLMIEGKESIIYTLNSIDLTGDSIVKLEDKNFNTDFAFQSFDAFSRFMFKKHYGMNHSSKGIIILLLLSMYNGIRPSSLLKLNWDDVIDIKLTKFNKEQISNRFFLDGKELNIPIELKALFESFLLSRHDYISFEEVPFHKKKIDDDSESAIFKINNGRRLTQPSLSREIKNTLTQIGFPHAKMFTTKSPLIMYGRKVIEIKGDHKPTIKLLMKHYKRNTKQKLLNYLEIDFSINKYGEVYEFKDKVRDPLFEEIFYDLPSHLLT